MLPPTVSRRHLYCSIYLLFSWCNLLSTVKATFTLTIDPYDEECFLLRTSTTMKSMKVLVGNYELLEGDESVSADPLLVYIIDEKQTEKLLYKSKPGEASGGFQVPIHPGGRGYWMCVQNSSHGPDAPPDLDEEEHPDFKTRFVGFSYRIVDIVLDKPAPLLIDEYSTIEWMQKSSDVENELRAMMNHQEYMRVRESQHRHVVEQTFSSLLFWSLAEALTVIFGAVGQVMYFRRFLEKKRYF